VNRKLQRSFWCWRASHCAIQHLCCLPRDLSEQVRVRVAVGVIVSAVLLLLTMLLLLLLVVLVVVILL